MYLDTLPIVKCNVGYGEVGLHSNLGYEGKEVSANGKRYARALSANGPSHLAFELGGRFQTFRCQVALSDHMPARANYADFIVRGDGIVLATVRGVTARQTPQEIDISVEDVQYLELEVTTDCWWLCHSVWLDPQLLPDDGATKPVSLRDCLWRTRIRLPSPIHARRCIATIVSPGYTELLDAMLGSLRTYGNCPDAALVVFAVDPDEECYRVIAKHGAQAIECESIAKVNCAVKSVLYSVARVIDAEQFVCMDADILVTGDLNPLFHALEVCAEDIILAAHDAYLLQSARTLGESLCGFYQGHPDDITTLLETPRQEADYPLIVNDGVFAARRASLLALDSLLRGLAPRPANWINSGLHNCARNQFLFNLALAHLDCGVALNEVFNMMPSTHTLDIDQTGDRPCVRHNQRPVHVVHFSGRGRNLYPELRGIFGGSKEETRQNVPG